MATKFYYAAGAFFTALVSALAYLLSTVEPDRVYEAYNFTLAIFTGLLACCFAVLAIASSADEVDTSRDAARKGN